MAGQPGSGFRTKTTYGGSVITTRILDQNEYLRTVLDAIPFMVLVVDADMKIHDANLAAAHLLRDEDIAGLKRRCGAALRCIHALEAREGCGTAPVCRECVCRITAQTALGTSTVSRRKCHMTIMEDGEPHVMYFDVTATPFAYHEDQLVLLLLEDTTELMLLRQIVPICVHCKRIRNADNSWEKIEDYLMRNSHLALSHGLCAECRHQLYPKPGRD